MNLSSELADALKAVTEARQAHRMPGWAYSCGEEFVLRHGQTFTPAGLPGRCKRGLPHYCYDNAERLARASGLLYVEGYAFPTEHIRIPTQHAWCAVPGDCRAVDPTWERPGAAYRGVPFDLGHAASVIDAGANILDGWEQGWPLLTGRTAGAAWRPAEWRYFEFREVDAAKAHADGGGVAVHHTGFPFRHWKYTCHLFAKDRAGLDRAAGEVGCNLKWRQEKSRRLHFDLFGTPLARALVRCGRPPKKFFQENGKKA